MTDELPDPNDPVTDPLPTSGWFADNPIDSSEYLSDDHPGVQGMVIKLPNGKTITLDLPPGGGDGDGPDAEPDEPEKPEAA